MGESPNQEHVVRHTLGTTDRGVPDPTRAVADSTFWGQQVARFESLREQAIRQAKRPLGAAYHPDGWGTEAMPASIGQNSGRWLLENATEVISEEFQSVAGLCAVATGAPNTDFAWVDWLEYLRRSSLDFEEAEFVVQSWAREPRPTPNAEISARGLISPPVEVRPDANVQLVSHELGGIRDVCASSARACRRMADETMKLEIQPLPLKREGTPVPAASTGTYTAAQRLETTVARGEPTTPPGQQSIRRRASRLCVDREWSRYWEPVVGRRSIGRSTPMLTTTPRTVI